MCSSLTAASASGPGLLIIYRQVVMMAKLTDKQRKRIIAEHINGATNVSLAKKYGVGEATIRRTIKADPKTTKKCERKKEENTATVLAYLDTKRDDVCNALGLLLKALQDPARIEKASMAQLATAYGVLVDKQALIEGKRPEQNDSGMLNGLIAGMNADE